MNTATTTARLGGPTVDVAAKAHTTALAGGHTAAGRQELIRTLMLFKREFIIVGALSAVANLLMLTPTLYMLQVYDRVMVSQNALTLVSVSFIALAMFGLMALAEWGRSRLLVATGLRLDDQLSTRVFNASFESHLAGANVPGRNPAKAFNDLLQVRQFITGNGIFAFFDLPWVPIYIAVMFLLHPFLGWLSIAFAVIQGLTAWLGHRRALEPAEAAQQAQLDANQFLSGKLRNAEVLESMGMVGNLKGPWLNRHHKAMGLAGSSQSTTHRITAISKFVRYTMQSLSLGAGALLVIQGELTAGAMIAANVLMTRALAPIDLLVATWRSFITARESFLRLADLLAEHPERNPALKRARPQGALKVDKVTVTAPGRPSPILHQVSLEVNAGEVLVVLGPSGSGKSTLARVMMGIWGETQGAVLMDGVPIETWDREELGPHVGYLPQDIELFDGTIAENIARMGEVQSEWVIAAAKAAGLHEMILRFPRGYDTSMGEAGSLLSGGQRQRVALARALYGQPTLVVLDEPNANLDDAGEQALGRAVLGLKQAGSTVVLVTHRPGAIGLADKLLVMQDGHVRLFGTRDDVLRALRPQAAPTPGATPLSSPAPAAGSTGAAPSSDAP
jgi:ATP-binding cassette subfamily C exporter for protease/lipase